MSDTEQSSDQRGPRLLGGEAHPPGPARTGPQAGQLTVAWQIMLAVTWTAVFFAFSAVWKTSEEIGIGTWWLGPRAQPQPLFIRIIPFLLAIAVTLCAVYNVRRVAWISIAGSLAIAVIAVFDMRLSGGLAAIEFTIAGAALLASIGALAGTVRDTHQLGPAR